MVREGGPDTGAALRLPRRRRRSCSDSGPLGRIAPNYTADIVAVEGGRSAESTTHYGRPLGDEGRQGGRSTGGDRLSASHRSALVPRIVRRPLEAAQTDRLVPLLVAARALPASLERVPRIPAAGIAEPGILLPRRPLTSRAPNPASRHGRSRACPVRSSPRLPMTSEMKGKKGAALPRAIDFTTNQPGATVGTDPHRRGGKIHDAPRHGLPRCRRYPRLSKLDADQRSPRTPRCQREPSRAGPRRAPGEAAARHGGHDRRDDRREPGVAMYSIWS